MKSSTDIHDGIRAVGKLTAGLADLDLPSPSEKALRDWAAALARLR